MLERFRAGAAAACFRWGHDPARYGLGDLAEGECDIGTRRVGDNPSVGGALSLRAWAFDLLLARPPGDGSTRPDCLGSDSSATWELFLRSERCALPLRSRLVFTSRTSLQPGPAQVLQARAIGELQRILSARGQLLQIRELAAAHGLEPIILKGGVATLSGNEPVDVDDVDVLLAEEPAKLLGRLLDDRGYRSIASWSVAHLAPRFAPEAVSVEVHFAIKDADQIPELRARARPFVGFPGLWRLSPPDHLWHLLVHSVVTHPYRRGCIRDLMLTSSAVRDCSPKELDEVTGRIARHRQGRLLTAILELARAVHSSASVTDCFRAEAAANYLLRGRFGWAARWRALAPMSTTVFVLLGSRMDRRAEWLETMTRPPLPSNWRFLAAMQRRWPRLGNVSQRILRIVRLVLGRLVAWPVAASARRLAERSAGSRARDQTVAV